jgi:hypothetical protein
MSYMILHMMLSISFVYGIMDQCASGPPAADSEPRTLNRSVGDSGLGSSGGGDASLLRTAKAPGPPTPMPQTPKLRRCTSWHRGRGGGCQCHDHGPTRSPSHGPRRAPPGLDAARGPLAGPTVTDPGRQEQRLGRSGQPGKANMPTTACPAAGDHRRGPGPAGQTPAAAPRPARRAAVEAPRRPGAGPGCRVTAPAPSSRLRLLRPMRGQPQSEMTRQRPGADRTVTWQVQT